MFSVLITVEYDWFELYYLIVMFVPVDNVGAIMCVVVVDAIISALIDTIINVLINDLIDVLIDALIDVLIDIIIDVLRDILSRCHRIRTKRNWCDLNESDWYNLYCLLTNPMASTQDIY